MLGVDAERMVFASIGRGVRPAIRVESGAGREGGGCDALDDGGAAIEILELDGDTAGIAALELEGAGTLGGTVVRGRSARERGRGSAHLAMSKRYARRSIRVSDNVECARISFKFKGWTASALQTACSSGPNPTRLKACGSTRRSCVVA
jgi:hypothetical protein